MYQLLIVDDEEAVVDNLMLTMPWETLQIAEIHKACSAPEALTLLEAHPIHIVITDIRMPGMSGLELVKRIAERWSRVKCLILSGYADFDYAKQALQNHTVDYLLKPIRESDLMQAVERVIGQIQSDWESISSFQRAQLALRDHLPLLRGNLLSELLQGKRLTSDALHEKLELFELSFGSGDAFSMILVRLEEELARHDFQSLSLLEYAIGNIAEELSQGVFELWSCKDVNDHLVFCVKLTAEKYGELTGLANGGEVRQKLLEQFALLIQGKVKVYLKGGISIVVGEWAIFPADMAGLYQQLLAMVRERLGRDREIIMIMAARECEARTRMQSLSSLYEPPLLQHLLDAGRWDAVQVKLRAIFGEVEQLQEVSAEHHLEVFLLLSSSAAYIVHKSGLSLAELLGEDAEPICNPLHRAPPNLQCWAVRVFERIQNHLERKMKDNRSGIVERIHAFINRKLSEDVSIQSIADHVFLHPAYLSRVYKLETGQSIGHYLLKLRMEKAAQLLKSSDHKIMDVAYSLGYQNATYFSKVFKNHYGMTPQHFRDDRAVQ